MIGQLLQADLEEIIRAQQWDALREALVGLDVSDIAELIIDLPPEDEGFVFRVLPRERASEVFANLPVDTQEELIRSLTNEQSVALLETMSPDDRVRLLEEMPAEVTRRILESLTPGELAATRTIMNYPENTAGRYMTPEYVSVLPEMNVEDALAHIRKTGGGKETLAIVYVVDQKGFLAGDLRLGRLVLADPQTKITQIDDRPLVSVPATADRRAMIEAFEKYDRPVLPVTDHEGKMLGIITADDVLDVAEEVVTEEIHKMGGQEALDEPYLNVGFWNMVRKRGGWLAILFLGEMLTATAMGYFEGEIERAAIVALFVPLIISSGGNSGSQGTSLIIRALAVKELRLRDWWRVFGRELRTGMALGLILGAIGFVRISAWQGLSQVPAVGSFFQTHGQTLPEGSQPGSIMVSEDRTLKSAVSLPAGTIISKGSVIPPSVALPPEMQEPPHEASAYGKHWLLIGATVFFSLIGVVTWGSLAGSMLPFVLRSFGFDPATSSAPFVATLVDVTGLVIYFLVAKVILTGTLL